MAKTAMLRSDGWRERHTRAMMCIRWENKVKFLSAEALRGVNTIFDAQGGMIDNVLGKRDYVTGTVLEQVAIRDKAIAVQRTGADGTDAAQGSEAQQS